MKTLRHLPSLLLASSLLFTGCQKDDPTPPASGGANTNISTVGTFRFKMDGVQHEMLATYLYGPQTTVAGQSATLAGSNATSSVNLSFHADSFTTGTVNSPFVSGHGFAFAYGELNNPNGYHSDLYVSEGTMNITHADTTAGGYVEGTFQMNGVWEMVNGQLQGGSHTVTDGYFKVPVGQ